MKEFTADQAMGVVAEASDCEKHPSAPTFSAQDIKHVLYYENGCNCGSSVKGMDRSNYSYVHASFNPETGTCGATYAEDGTTTDYDYCDHWSVTFFRLKDGRYVYASESSDTSGHG
jgi:hypothetical protein